MKKNTPSLFKKAKLKNYFNSLLSYGLLSALILGAIFLGNAIYQGKEIGFVDMSSALGKFLVPLAYLLLAFKIFFFLFLLRAYKMYRPIATVSDNELPHCTVIIPAFNEGEQVYKTLLSLQNSNYPAHKISLIAIDDGSSDDTWWWMQKAKAQMKDSLIILQQKENKGKREALYRAFMDISTEVVVTVDSDSLVEKNTLRNLVSPFVTHKNCGAVAGNVKVLNLDEGIIPRMLNVSFTFSFEFIRSAQSFYGSVLCTPGALSAYRKKAVDQCLEQWVNQTFLGKQTQIGEDRAMTNMILKQGYDVNFQANANVITEIPISYNQLRKMFTRWERSNVRENIMMTKFAFGNFRRSQKWPSRILLVNQWIKIIFAYPALVLMFVFLFLKPALFIYISLSSILIFASIPALFFYYRYRNFNQSLLSYSYSAFYAFSLFWITPYAILTARNNGWLTRVPKV